LDGPLASVEQYRAAQPSFTAEDSFGWNPLRPLGNFVGSTLEGLGVNSKLADAANNLGGIENWSVGQTGGKLGGKVGEFFKDEAAANAASPERQLGRTAATAALVYGGMSAGAGAGTGESAAAGGADSATSAAWGSGAGLGEDTLGAVGANGAGLSGETAALAPSQVGALNETAVDPYGLDSGWAQDTPTNQAGGLSPSGQVDPISVDQVPQTHLNGTETLSDAGITPTSDTLSSAGDFAKANPQLVAGLGAAALNHATSGNVTQPTTQNTGGAASDPALIAALQQKLGATAGNTAPTAVTSAGDPSQYYQQAADAAYNKQTTYLDPQVKQQQQALEARLSEQGFVPGTPGYQQAMQTFQDSNARAYQAARDSAVQQGMTGGQNMFQNSLSNANLSNGVGRDSFSQALQSYNSLTGQAQTQYSNALDKYNADVASQNSNNQMLAQLATALGMYYSDARLKDNISPIGQTPGGANLYSYTIFGRREIGVIAQELQITQPAAVTLDPASGFLMVDYRKVR
jgi:hypothetical protein